MLKSSHKKMQNTGIKKDGKINTHEQLKCNQYELHILYTACMRIFDFSFN